MNHRTASFDLIRVFTILGVVAIHAEAVTSSPTNYLGGLSWWFANTVHSLFIVSVPLFIMLSGALVLHKPHLTYRYVLSKIWFQFGVPLVFWWLLYSWWGSISHGLEWSVGLALQQFYFTTIGHLYFLQVIIGLYLVMPLLHRFLRIASQRQQAVVLCVATVAAMLYEYLSFLVFKIYNNSTFFFLFLPYVSYLLWGYYLAQKKITAKWWWAFVVMVVVLVLLISGLSYWNTVAFNRGQTNFWTPQGGNFFREHFTIPVMLLSGMLFMLLQNIEVVWPKLLHSNKVKKILLLLAEVSFGVYLIHPLVMEQIDHYFNFSIQFVTSALWLYYIKRTVIVFTISAVLVWLIKKMPLLTLLLGNKPASNVKKGE